MAQGNQENFFEPLVEFAEDAKRLLLQARKPDAKEFMKTIEITVRMFFICGAIGFAVRLLALPMKHILIGG